MSESRIDHLKVPTAGDMEQLGRSAASALRHGQLIFLQGDLGTGKTTWVRGLLRGLHYRGPVKSPTYTLLEPYTFGDLRIFHFDLYRLNDPEELEQLAFRDCLEAGVCVVEWPERAAAIMPEPDCRIEIEYDNGTRRVNAECRTELGKALCSSMQ